MLMVIGELAGHNGGNKGCENPAKSYHCMEFESVKKFVGGRKLSITYLVWTKRSQLLPLSDQGYTGKSFKVDGIKHFSMGPINEIVQLLIKKSPILY